MPENKSESIETVRAFLAALEDLDIDLALTHVAPGIVYQNVPLPPARGAAAVGKQLRTMAKYATGFEARIHTIAAESDGVRDTVLTERTDVLIKGRWKAEFWVCGTFEVHDGKITLWRDYFDWTTILVASLRGVGGLLLRSRRGFKPVSS
jgi:limonene-1,2-epoxide hydrolase